mgnify:CR=1 FL=1
MLNQLIKKIKNQLNLTADSTQMDQAILRVKNAQQLVLLRTDYLE